MATALSVTGLAASIGIGLIFTTAGIVKLRHRRLLPGVIANYRLLPDALVSPAATLLPLAEILIGAALIAGLRPVPALLGIALLGLFALAMAINILRGRSHISCGCGRPELSQSLSWTLVLRNLLFGAALLLRLPELATLAGIDLVTAVAAGLSLALLAALMSSIGAIGTAPALASRR
ncbi:methylamine utilization protein MauE [Sphingobium sp. H33]|uniref:Methylamine utilization protein MauE n=1 Tax=Sphingobium nicotianae TaxID=2782607 RepID=A0A9X1DCD1_9SPHN|nr:methylamine utilization protein MauE [Sphingobium nicotianae]